VLSGSCASRCATVTARHGAHRVRAGGFSGELGHLSASAALADVFAVGETQLCSLRRSGWALLIAEAALGEKIMRAYICGASA